MYESAILSGFAPILLCMVQDNSEIRTACVGVMYLRHDMLELPATEISLNDFKFSCHRNANEQDLRNLIAVLERDLRNIILDAYHGVSERIT